MWVMDSSAQEQVGASYTDLQVSEELREQHFWRESPGTDLTLKRCIVILRQFLKCHNYNLYSKEKFIKGVKHNIYYVGHESDKNIVPMRKEKIVISFD